MGLFSKKTELEKLMKEKEELQGKATGLQNSIQAVNGTLKLAETDYMIDSSATNKKRLDKYKKAIRDYQKELSKIQKEADKVSQGVSQLNAEKRKEELDEIAKRDLDNYSSFYRSKRLTDLLYKMKYDIEEGSNNLSMMSPTHLKKEAGFEYGNFNPENPAHKPYMELWLGKKEQLEEEVEKELKTLKQQINRFLN